MTDEHHDAPTTTRSEERLRVSTRRIAIGRAVVRKTVVVEERTITVQVRHEVAHLEVVPVDEALPAEDQGSAAHLALPEFVLHREEVVVTRRVVPVERVRLRVEPVVEQQQVVADLRREVVDLDPAVER